MEDSPGLSVWTQCNHKFPYKKKQEKRTYDDKSGEVGPRQAKAIQPDGKKA